MTSVRLGIYGQWLALIVSVAGLVAMIWTVSPLDDTLVVAGSVLLTIATKIRYYGKSIMAWARRSFAHHHKRKGDNCLLLAEIHNVTKQGD